MRRNSNILIVRMVTVALLSALGIVMMLFVKFPYPFAPWIEIEFSDITILIGYALTNFVGALAIAIIKTLISLFVQPVGIYYIGQLAAFLSSFTYLFCLFLSVKVFKWFKKGIKFRILAYCFIVLVNSLFMTLLNYLFITPTYLTGEYTTCFNAAAVELVEKSLGKFGTNYFTMIFVLYLPFNILKAFLNCLVYEIVFNTLFFVLLKENPTFNKYFSKSKKEENNKVSQ